LCTSGDEDGEGAGAGAADVDVDVDVDVEAEELQRAERTSSLRSIVYAPRNPDMKKNVSTAANAPTTTTASKVSPNASAAGTAFTGWDDMPKMRYAWPKTMYEHERVRNPFRLWKLPVVRLLNSTLVVCSAEKHDTNGCNCNCLDSFFSPLVAAALVDSGGGRALVAVVVVVAVVVCVCVCAHIIGFWA
jgi:hypothetical protein